MTTNEEKLYECGDGKMRTQEEKKQYHKELWENRSQEEKDEDELPELDAEEIAFRRGYTHGFLWSRLSPEVSFNDVRTWNASKKVVCPPGTPLAGTPMGKCKEEIIKS